MLLAAPAFSGRSARGYARIGGLTTALLRMSALIAAQADMMPTLSGAGRAAGRGDRQSQIRPAVAGRSTNMDGNCDRNCWAGNGRFGLPPTPTPANEQILDTFARLRERWPLLLLLVPRHPERFAGVATLCRQRGFSLVGRSRRQPCRRIPPYSWATAWGNYCCSTRRPIWPSSAAAWWPTGGRQRPGAGAARSAGAVRSIHMFNFTEAGQRCCKRKQPGKSAMPRHSRRRSIDC